MEHPLSGMQTNWFRRSYISPSEAELLRPLGNHIPNYYELDLRPLALSNSETEDATIFLFSVFPVVTESVEEMKLIASRDHQVEIHGPAMNHFPEVQELDWAASFTPDRMCSAMSWALSGYLHFNDWADRTRAVMLSVGLNEHVDIFDTCLSLADQCFRQWQKSDEEQSRVVLNEAVIHAFRQSGLEEKWCHAESDGAMVTACQELVLPFCHVIHSSHYHKVIAAMGTKLAERQSAKSTRH